MIKQEDLIEGIVYFGHFTGDDLEKDPKYLIIGQSEEFKYSNMPYLYISNTGSNSYSSFGSLESPRFIVDRIATSLETLWMKQCIKKNYLVPQPKEEIINNYSIY